MKAPSQILIIGHRNIGDVLHNMALLRPLRQAFPETKLTMLTSSSGFTLLSHNPYVSDVIAVESSKGFYNKLRRLSLIRKLRQMKCDLVINLKSGSYLPYFLGAKTIWNIRPEDKTLHHKRTRHAIDIYLDTIRHHGIRATPGDLDLKIYLTDDERKHSQILLENAGVEFKRPLIIFAPFSNWHAKEWVPERLGKLSNHLRAEWNAQIIFVGGPEDRHKMKEVEVHASGIVNLVGKLSLRELAALYEKASLNRISMVMGVDSGPFHLATHMGIPSLALFGATSHLRARPYFEPDNVITCETNLGCNPCIPGPHFMACGVYNRATPCMEQITLERVLEKTKKIFGQVSRG